MLSVIVLIVAYYVRQGKIAVLRFLCAVCQHTQSQYLMPRNKALVA